MIWWSGFIAVRWKEPLWETILLTAGKNVFGGFFTYARENKKFIMSTYASVQKDYLLRFMYTYIVKIISNILDEMAEGITVAPEKRKFITDFIPMPLKELFFHG